MKRNTYAWAMGLGLVMLLLGIMALVLAFVNMGSTPTNPAEIAEQAQAAVGFVAGLTGGGMLVALGMIMMVLAQIGNDVNAYVYLVMKKTFDKMAGQ